MRVNTAFVVMFCCFFATHVSATTQNQNIDDLFPDEGLRYKSCSINLTPKDDGYEINIKRDCPSGYCYNYQMSGSIAVNTQQIEVFGKTLTNSHKLDSSNKTTKLEVKEYGEWHEYAALLGGSGIFGSDEQVLVGSFQTKLEMRVSNNTGEVESFKAYSKGNVNWIAAARGGVMSLLRSMHGFGKKIKLVDCDSPGQEMRRTLIYLLEEEVSVYGGDKVLSEDERATLDTKLLQHLSADAKDEYVEEMFGNTPLHYAARYGLERFAHRLIKVLPEEGGSGGVWGNPINFINSNGNTPLHLAAKKGQAGMVMLLLAANGIDTTIQNYDDETAQQIAIANATKYCEADATSQDCKNAQEIVAMFEQR